MIHLMCRIFTLDSILEDNMVCIKWKLNYAPPSTPHPLPSPFLHTPLPADIGLINFTKLEFSMLETLIPPVSFLGPAMIWWLFIMTHDICVWRRLTKKSPLKLTFKQLNIRPVEIQQSHLKLTHPPPTPKLIKIKFQQCFACGLISWIHLVLYCVDYR